MKNWFKSLSKESVQRIIFFGLVGVLFTAFFISLQFVETENPTDDTPQTDSPNTPEDDPANTPSTPEAREKFMAPTLSETYNVLRTYFDETLEEAELEKAVMKYEDGKYLCSLGVSLGLSDNSQFEVVATMSGVVSSVSVDSLYGNIVTITHSDGYTSEYSSLSEVVVKVGDSVSQGDVLGLSGESVVDSECGNHVYFIIRKNGVTINPMLIFGKSPDELSS